jgi:D-tyrosyl-tRNA(Tyr) deacylase
MRAVCQRVTEARVRIDDAVVGEIGVGIVILLGVQRADAEAQARRLAAKIAALRIFPDEEGKFDRSLVDTSGEALAISQFTLLADTSKGNRPSFTNAAPPDAAEPLYDLFCTALEAVGIGVARGRFGARMAVELVNDGPVTIVIDEPGSA